MKLTGKVLAGVVMGIVAMSSVAFAQATGNSMQEMLKKAVTQAVGVLNQPNSFNNNSALKFDLPKQFASAENALRQAGKGAQVDQLINGLNKTASQAAPQAKDALLKMATESTLTSLMSGQNQDKFKSVLKPIIHQAFTNNKLGQQFSQLQQTAANIPGAQALAGNFSLEDYVCDSTVKGVFTLIGQKQKEMTKASVSSGLQGMKNLFGAK